jgi:hypothetical protein
MESADAFELKAQALNNDSRLKSAGIAALKFTGDKKYIADGDFLFELPPPATPSTVPQDSKSTSAFGKRLRVVLRMPSEDSYELKAKALNNDAHLKETGIAAIKYVGDKKYISNGEFSSEPAPTASKKIKSEGTEGRVRVVLRMPNEDSYELKAKALNDDPRLNDTGIAALKFVGDKQYISGGEFSPDIPTRDSKKDITVDEKIRVSLRVPRKDAYELIAKHLNNDSELIKAGISGVELAKGAGMVPVMQERPAQPPKKKRSFAKYAIAALIFFLVGVTGVGALFLSYPPVPTPTAVAIIPVSGGDPTNTSTPVPPTDTSIPPTSTPVPTNSKTSTPTPTNTQEPSPTVLSCQPPKEITVVAENLSCRYGPGAVYLYRTGLGKDQVVDVLGKADTAYGTWIRVQTRWQEPAKCWVSASPKYIEVPPDEDVACLEPLYPEKAPLILFNTDLFPKPYNVSTSRSGDLVYINWVGFDLLPGDRPEASPAYLTETWTCQDGKLVFSPQGWDEPSGWVRDEGGCAEASYGYVYMAHVDGYLGPVPIPWPP